MFFRLSCIFFAQMMHRFIGILILNLCFKLCKNKAYSCQITKDFLGSHLLDHPSFGLSPGYLTCLALPLIHTANDISDKVVIFNF